ncbi:hypothetical protein C5167_036469 [Papaver somniferum]|uniref:Uncharacterized protein n=1 Tax=Papaver somniferum TaxID=3469 RepID=A0A4Y7I7B4_PAPSO|nr:hypothetical protein C5167_036469 [Papaver somniferum]
MATTVLFQRETDRVFTITMRVPEMMEKKTDTLSRRVYRHQGIERHKKYHRGSRWELFKGKYKTTLTVHHPLQIDHSGAHKLMLCKFNYLAELKSSSHSSSYSPCCTHDSYNSWLHIRCLDFYFNTNWQ